MKITKREVQFILKRRQALAQDEMEIKKKIADFFSNNPNPPDKDVHAFAENLGIDEHKFEEVIYSLLGSFFGQGRSKDFDGEYDADELKRGVEVEKEHTDCDIIAERIAKDHLAELKDYYTKLSTMEKEAGIDE